MGIGVLVGIEDLNPAGPAPELPGLGGALSRNPEDPCDDLLLVDDPVDLLYVVEVVFDP